MKNDKPDEAFLVNSTMTTLCERNIGLSDRYTESDPNVALEALKEARRVLSLAFGKTGEEDDERPRAGRKPRAIKPSSLATAREKLKRQNEERRYAAISVGGDS